MAKGNFRSPGARVRNFAARKVVSDHEGTQARPLWRAMRFFGGDFLEDRQMAIRDIAKNTVRGFAVATMVGAVALATTPTPAQARVSTGAAVGIGLGAFALGSALGAAPYYGG